MPQTQVFIYLDHDGSAPLLEWLDALRPPKAVAKCLAMIDLLGQLGIELRRPHADFLRDGVFELRARLGKVHYRILYFFHGQTAVVTHGFIKAGKRVAPTEIDRTIAYRVRSAKDPEGHTYREED
jgi:phage-related protein